MSARFESSLAIHRYLGVCLCFGLACQLTPPTSTSTVSLSDGWLAMDTFFEVEVRVDASDWDAAREWIHDAREEIDRLERIYSRHDPESELSRFNRRAAADDRESSEGDFAPELTALLDQAERLRIATGGRFDVRFGPEVDLDGFSKGAVLDRLRADFMGRFKQGAALLSFGQSSIAAIGDPDGMGWRLVLESNDPSRGLLGTVRLRDQSLSMSSSLGRLREIDGRFVSHVVDPKTGQPVSGTIESVVVAESATEADAWSTALLVLGALPSSEQTRPPIDFEATLIDSAGVVHRTDGWKALAAD